jgi:2-phospho-L-lactate guanylyltransferase
MDAMSKLNVVIPVKDPTHAKERLAGVLTADQRTGLALVLFERVLSFFGGLPDPPHVLVVTDADAVAQLARRLGADILMEEEATGETAAVEKATEWSVAQGYASQLVVPGDMATLDRAEMLQLLAHPRENPSAVLCPATGDDGTNAVLLTPPNAIAYRFGDRSFPDYQARAKQHDVPCHVLRLPSLVLDLDTPDDLREFLCNHKDHPAARLLTQWNIHKKL